MLMLPLQLPWTLIGAACVGASGFLMAGVQTIRLSSEKQAHISTKLEHERGSSAAIRQAIADRDAAQTNADRQSKEFEAWKLAQKSKIQSIRKQVQDEKSIDPVCSTRPLPDSLRDALSRAPGDFGASDASEPGGLPSVERKIP